MTPHLRGRITYLDGHRLRRVLLAGIAHLLPERAHLDRINVFPVPDGDTGTNLVLTFGTIGERLSGAQVRSAGELLLLVAEAALDGARGNSGAIFAQYLQGFARACGGKSRLTTDDVGTALSLASRLAREALADPQDGTVLTVMRDLAEAWQRPVQPRHSGDGDRDDFAARLACAVEAARRSVAATRTTLSPMRRAAVEDAGALALLLLVEGMAEALQPGRAPHVLPPLTHAPLAARHDSLHSAASEHRYCTECIVTAESLDAPRLRAELTAVGSSVAVVSGAQRARLHVHVDDPEQAFRIARRYGAISAEKADDMARQERGFHQAGQRVAIVADSGADLPAEVWDEFGIRMVPLRINFGARSYLDKSGLRPGDFYRELGACTDWPTTSQPAPGDFRRAFELLSSHFEHIVAISLTARLSGTHQAALAAARLMDRPEQVTVIDSLSASVGQGLVALCAAEHARAGREPAEVVAAVRECLGRTRAYAVVPDLAAAVRGGRVPRAWRWLALGLPLSLVLATDGTGGLKLRSAVRRRGDRAGGLLRPALADARTGATHRLAIAHGNCPDLAEDLRRRCQQRFPGVESIQVTDLGPTFAVHGGEGTLALAVQEYQAPPEPAPTVSPF